MFGPLLEVVDCLTYLLAWLCIGRDLYQFDDLWQNQLARSSKLWPGRMVLGFGIGVVILFVRAVMHRRVMLGLYLPIVWIAAVLIFLLLNLLLIHHDPFNARWQWLFSCILAALAIAIGLIGNTK